MFRSRSPRHPTVYKTALRAATRFVPALAINASHTGCLFRVDGPLRQGQRVSFTLLNQRIDGIVVRDQVGRVAVKFHRPLDRQLLDALRLGAGHDEMPDHVTADRTTALRAMSRLVRRNRMRREPTGSQSR